MSSLKWQQCVENLVISMETTIQIGIENCIKNGTRTYVSPPYNINENNRYDAMKIVSHKVAKDYFILVEDVKEIKDSVTKFVRLQILLKNMM